MSLLVKGSKKDTLVPNKLLAIRRDAWARMLRLAQEFVMTPAARTRIEVSSAAGDDEDNPFAG